MRCCKLAQTWQCWGHPGLHLAVWGHTARGQTQGLVYARYALQAFGQSLASQTNMLVASIFGEWRINAFVVAFGVWVTPGTAQGLWLYAQELILVRFGEIIQGAED